MKIFQPPVFGIETTPKRSMYEPAAQGSLSSAGSLTTRNDAPGAFRSPRATLNSKVPPETWYGGMTGRTVNTYEEVDVCTDGHILCISWWWRERRRLKREVNIHGCLEWTLRHGQAERTHPEYFGGSLLWLPRRTLCMRTNAANSRRTDRWSEVDDGYVYCSTDAPFVLSISLMYVTSTV